MSEIFLVHVVLFLDMIFPELGLEFLHRVVFAGYVFLAFYQLITNYRCCAHCTFYEKSTKII